MSESSVACVDHSVDLSNLTYKLTEAIRRYTNDDGPIERNNTKFKKYLLGHEHAEDKYDEINSHGFGISWGHLDDDDTDAIDFSNVVQMRLVTSAKEVTKWRIWLQQLLQKQFLLFQVIIFGTCANQH